MTLSSLSQLLLPTFMSGVVNEGVYEKDFSVILEYCGQMLAVALVGAAATVLGRKCSAEVVAGFSANLRGAVFRKAMSMSHKAFGRMDTGALVTRSTQDVNTVSWVAEMLSGGKAYWFRLDENGELVGGISKFVAEKKDEVIEKLGLTKNSFVALAAGKYGAAVKTAGALRKLLGAQVEGHMDAERYEFCWIVDFPMYEIGEESGELEFCHNPFSMPQGGLEALERAHRGEIDPLTINAYQYDLVCNGVELSSGAVRNHDPEIMIKAFQLVRLGEDDVKKKFPAMYNAFCYGAPPHAGIAPGIDRMVMLLAGEDCIREIIPFPMNKNAQDILMGAPSEVTQKQLDELHIRCTAKEED